MVKKMGGKVLLWADTTTWPEKKRTAAMAEAATTAEADQGEDGRMFEMEMNGRAVKAENTHTHTVAHGRQKVSARMKTRAKRVKINENMMRRVTRET